MRPFDKVFFQERLAYDPRLQTKTDSQKMNRQKADSWKIGFIKLILDGT